MGKSRNFLTNPQLLMDFMAFRSSLRRFVARIVKPQDIDDILQETYFILGSRELGDLRVGGYFTAGDIDGLLLTLKDNFGIRSERISTSRILLQPAR